MARYDAGNKVGCAGDAEKPRGQKMQTTGPSILVEDLEGPAGTLCGTGLLEKRKLIGPPAVLMVPADGQFQDCGVRSFPVSPPIQPGMVHQNQGATDSQCHKAGRDDPMDASNPGGVSTRR